MYQYVKAVLKERGKNKTWVETNVSLMTLSQIFSRFVSGHIELTNAVIGPGSFYVDLNALRGDNVRFINMNFEDYITAISPHQFPHLATEPVYETKSILFADARQASFKLQRVYPDDPTHEMESELLTDILVGKDFINVDHLKHRALFTVNGFLHRTVPWDEENVLIKDGGRSVLNSKNQTVGAISFAAIGDLQQIPFTDGMISSVGSRQPLRKAAYINLGVDITNKSVMVSIGGYLHLEDAVVDVVSLNPGVIRVSLDDIDWVRRVFEMRRHIGIDHLQLSESNTFSRGIVVDELYTDAFARRVLTMAQSFAIVVDTPTLWTEKLLISRSTFGCFHESPTEPLYPLVTQSGRMLDYWYRNENGNWVLDIDPTMVRDYLYRTSSWKESGVASEVLDHVSTQTPFGHLLAIHSTRVN